MLAALGASGLSPEDSQHIGYLRLAWTREDHLKDIGYDVVPQIRKTPDMNSDAVIVPFEWFQRGKLEAIARSTAWKKNNPKQVLILWLPESAFHEHPLTRLAQVIDAISHDSGDGLRIDMIGPSYSGTLREMVREIKSIPENKGYVRDANQVDVRSMLEDLTIFSPWSTVSPALLVDDIDDLERYADSRFGGLYDLIPTRFEKKGVKFVRMIGSDDLLAMELIRELRRRGVNLIESWEPAHAALMSEYDTLYGQTFPLTFATMLRRMKYSDLPDSEPEWVKYVRHLRLKLGLAHPGWANSALCIHTYARAVDGKLEEAESPGDGQPGEETESKSKWAYNKNLELPIGRGQLDYVRRLAETMDVEHNDERRWSGGERLDAIGVVGSDVYDKLVLLHALREQFDNIVFFMTDLDARITHHEQAEWTRNVIVASNFGLKLAKQYQSAELWPGQSNLPPFRDNYQTALFFACRVALGLTEDNEGKTLFRDMKREDLIDLFSHPRIFEIGHSSAVDLTVLPKEAKAATEIHPGNSRLPDRKVFLKCLPLVVLGIAACVLLLVQVSPGLLEAIIPGDRRKGTEETAASRSSEKPMMPAWITWLLAAVVIGFAITVIVDHYRPTGEPFSLFAGISVWPGETLRLIAAVLSVCMIFKSLRILENNENDLHKWFEFEKPDRVRESAISYKKWRRDEDLSGWSNCPFNPLTWWRYRRDKISICRWRTGIGKEEVEAQQLWTEYRARGACGVRFHRLIPMSIEYGVLCAVLMLMLGLPGTPYRGRVSQVTDRVLLILSVSLMITLIFFVVDATRLSLRFIKNLKEPETRWPPELIKRYAGHKIEEGAGHVGDATKSAESSKNDAVEKAEGLAEWLDTKFIGHHTKAIGTLIYCPFIIFLLMLVARNPYLDNWDFPISLMIVFLLNLIYALWCAMKLRHEAQQARRVALKRLQEQLVEATGDGDGRRTSQLEVMIEQVKSIREGAYSPATENPVLHAILIPSGGVSLLTLLRFIPLP
jgi:hypothetical protein